VNILDYLYFYNGAGVASADFNNDGLEDLYFVSNQGPNKLYLNKGDLKFEDITAKAGVAGTGNWKTGVTVVDINGDGLKDIYVCVVSNYKGFKGKNQLYINNGDLTFTESQPNTGSIFQASLPRLRFLIMIKMAIWICSCLLHRYIVMIPMAIRPKRFKVQP
jgi:hypothetical protein